MKFIMKLFATGLGTGYSLIAPGTCGSVVGVLLYYAIKSLPIQHYVMFVVAFIFFASWVSRWGEYIFGEEDPKKIVIDEIAGFTVVMIGLPFNWPFVIVGFILFRIFDIAKPFPIGMLEKRIKGGFGVVLDDVLAGVYANLALRLIIWAAPRVGLNLF